MDGEHAGHERHRANGHAHGPTPIALAGLEYAEHGLPLVLLPPKSKGEHGMRKGWNLRENAVADAAVIAHHRGNIGLALAWSRVASIDIDHVQGAHAWLEPRGVDLMQLLMAPDAVRIESGVPNRAKLLYALPAGANASDYITQRIHDDAKNVILELRCAARGGKTMQDVLPPSIHPSTGQPYRWRGDWRHLPALPYELQRVWHLPHTAPHNTAHGPRDDARGDGSGDDFRDVFERLERAGCKPHVTAPGDARAHCPVHKGKSGTTLHINESADGKVLLHCHAGCTWEEVFAALEMGSGPEVRMGNGPRAETHERASEADTPEPAPDTLPPCPAALSALPKRLGEVQAAIASTMLRPHAGLAGLVTLALVDYLAMANTRIASRGGLGMGEFFMVLAPTAFGKEALRLPFRTLAEYCANPRHRIPLPDLRFSAPSSQQGLQEMLIASPCVCMLPDEFGDWIAKGEKEPYRAEAMAHLMQVYGNAFGTVDVPHAVTHKLPSVKNPRLLMFATSTPARIVEVLNGSLASRGFLNRFVMLPITANDMGLTGNVLDTSASYEISPALCALARDISSAQELVAFDTDAIDYINQHFRKVLDPLAISNNVLAGRLNEQAIRMAACIALADGRQIIGVRDMALAYEIREGLYERTAAFFADAGNLGDGHPTALAYEQCRRIFERYDSVKRSRLPALSRLYACRPPRERNDIVRALIADGIVYERERRLFSLIRDDKDDKGTT